jgi:hypothetical protein
MGNKESIYDRLTQRATTTSQGSRGGGQSGTRRGYTPRSSGGGGGRFSGTPKKPSTGGTRNGRTDGARRGGNYDRGEATPVKKDGRVVAIDNQDRDMAYQPPVARPEQAVAWSPPSLWDILSDLGLRVVEVGIASIAQEVAYFFAKRRFLPQYMRQPYQG